MALGRRQEPDQPGGVHGTVSNPTSDLQKFLKIMASTRDVDLRWILPSVSPVLSDGRRWRTEPRQDWTSS